METDKYSKFVINLKKLCESNHIAMVRVAENIGVSRVTLSRYVEGLRKPDLEVVIKVSEYFGVSVDWLLGLSSDHNIIQADDSISTLVKKYAVASNEDKGVIDLILSKYEVEE